MASRRSPALKSLDLKGIAEFMQSKSCRNIIIMSGAGISTSAGIPDFRSPGTGLYDNLAKYGLPHPQAIFELDYFKTRPEPFFTLARELYPGTFKPTVSHYFMRLLADKGRLLRLYTQNIDTLERVAGIPDSYLVEAHGSFHQAHCVGCKKLFSQDWVKTRIFKGEIPRCDACQSLVKPDIVFFGEQLPSRFFKLIEEDFRSCDLLIIAGTSLVVQPFASLVDYVGDKTPRLLINREKVGQGDPMMRLMGLQKGLDFDSEDNVRDVAHLDSCDNGFLQMAELLGWKDELEALMKRDHARIEQEVAAELERQQKLLLEQVKIKEDAGKLDQAADALAEAVSKLTVDTTDALRSSESTEDVSADVARDVVGAVKDGQ